MCGIFSLASKEVNDGKELLQRLQRLEYRGYDSFGWSSQTNKDWYICKHVGKVSDPKNYFDKDKTNVKFKTAISHTRWATHGVVNETNTHPHMSYDRSVSIVHNGVIENYKELRTFLHSKGIDSVSETDTEVICNLLAYNFNQLTNLKRMTRLEGLQTCLRRLKGSYAISFICADEPDIIYFAKKGSPLVLGKATGTSYISSDIYTFIDKTDNVLYLSDGDYGYVSPGRQVRYNLDSPEKINNFWTKVNASYDQVDLGNYQYYMIKEICEQQHVIENTVRNQPQQGLETLLDKVNTSRRVLFSACGSSYYSSMVAAHLLRSEGILAECVLSSEFESHTGTLSNKDLVICVSQSGETADIIESINFAKEKGCYIVGIINVPNSTIDRLSDHTIYVNAGPELCVLSTKSFTSQVAIFILLWEKISQKHVSYEALESNMYELVAESTRNAIRSVAEKINNKEHIYVLGKGIQYPVALEAALKIKEVSYIHAEGFAGGELKHGSIALIEPGTPCILLVNEQYKLELLANGAELKSRGAIIIGVAAENDDLYDHYIRVNETSKSGPLLQIIPIQLLAYNLALLRGLDPDRPRNLAKSVTVK